MPLALLALTVPACSQSAASRAPQGHGHRSHGCDPGSKVTIRNADLASERVVTTNQAGRFVSALLPYRATSRPGRAAQYLPPAYLFSLDIRFVKDITLKGEGHHLDLFMDIFNITGAGNRNYGPESVSLYGRLRRLSSRQPKPFRT